MPLPIVLRMMSRWVSSIRRAPSVATNSMVALEKCG
jgi:hypothetical protein